MVAEGSQDGGGRGFSRNVFDFFLFSDFFFLLPCFLYRPKIFTPQHIVVEGFKSKSLRSPKLKVLATKEIFAFSFFA